MLDANREKGKAAVADSLRESIRPGELADGLLDSDFPERRAYQREDPRLDPEIGGDGVVDLS
jgi:hypothetical protein